MNLVQFKMTTPNRTVVFNSVGQGAQGDLLVKARSQIGRVAR